MELDQLDERRQRMAGKPLDLGRARAVAEHERVRHAAVEETHRHARVRGMDERALSLDEEQVGPATLVPLEEEPLGRAGEEVGDDGVDRDPPAGDRDARLARRDELRGDAAAAGLEVELQRHGLLPDRAVGADREHDPRRHLQVRPRRHVETRRRLPQVAELDPVPGRELAQLRVLREELVQPVLDVQALRDAALQQLAPLGREAAAGRRDADDGGVGAEAERVVDGADDRHAVLCLARPLRVEERGDRFAFVADDPARRLPVVRVAREPFSEDEVARHAASVVVAAAAAPASTTRAVGAGPGIVVP